MRYNGSREIPGLSGEDQIHMSTRTFTVTAWTNGDYGWGFEVSPADRSEYFERDWRSVSLTLIGRTRTTVECNVTRSFWKCCRELRRAAIGRWFKDNGFAPPWNRKRPRFHMTPTGDAEFEVKPLAPGDAS